VRLKRDVTAQQMRAIGKAGQGRRKDAVPATDELIAQTLPTPRAAPRAMNKNRVMVFPSVHAVLEANRDWTLS
jgi:hypothetical protein